MISQEPKFSCLSCALNLVTGEKVLILEALYNEQFRYLYRVRSLVSGGLYEVNQRAYYPEGIFCHSPVLTRNGKIGNREYIVYVVSPFVHGFYSVMYAIDGVFRTGKNRGYYSNLIGSFACFDEALRTGISLVMEELQRERK